MGQIAVIKSQILGFWLLSPLLLHLELLNVLRGNGKPYEGSLEGRADIYRRSPPYLLYYCF